MPWDLDPALLRRLEKRIFVPMPNEEARKAMLKRCLSLHTHNLKEEDFDECALQTKGYNGADIKLVCKEAAMSPIRSIFAKLEEKETYTKESSKMKGNFTIDVKAMLTKNPITRDDLMTSLKSTKPSTDQRWQQKYMDWSDKHGAI